jgi:hypothetical protein
MIYILAQTLNSINNVLQKPDLKIRFYPDNVTITLIIKSMYQQTPISQWNDMSPSCMWNKSQYFIVYFIWFYSVPKKMPFLKIQKRTKEPFFRISTLPFWNPSWNTVSFHLIVLTFLSKTSAYLACIQDMYNERWTQDLHRHRVLCIWSRSTLLGLNKIPCLLYEQLSFCWGIIRNWRNISPHANFLIIFLYDGFFLIFKVEEIIFYILDW